jgi:hypothetical protein
MYSSFFFAWAWTCLFFFFLCALGLVKPTANIKSSESRCIRLLLSSIVLGFLEATEGLHPWRASRGFWREIDMSVSIAGPICQWPASQWRPNPRSLPRLLPHFSPSPPSLQPRTAAGRRRRGEAGGAWEDAMPPKSDSVEGTRLCSHPIQIPNLTTPRRISPPISPILCSALSVHPVILVLILLYRFPMQESSSTSSTR